MRGKSRSVKMIALILALMLTFGSVSASAAPFGEVPDGFSVTQTVRELFYAAVRFFALLTGREIELPERETAPEETTAAFWKCNADTRVRLVKNSFTRTLPDGLQKLSESFVSSLASVLGRKLTLSDGYNAALSGKHDILLIADDKAEIAKEGYDVFTEGGRLIVRASDENGLFYGCAEVVRQLRLRGVVVPASSSPDVGERALFLDIGRKYYTPAWIKSLIKELSAARMNTLVIHFSEEMGLGLESKKYPWLNGRDGTLCTQREVPTDNRQITQAEMADIIAFARDCHVEIVPSFDSPGHMNYIVRKFNARAAKASLSFTSLGKIYRAPAGTDIGNYYHTGGKTAIVQGSRNKAYSRGIDLTNEYAVAFTKSLIDEYASFFSSLGCRKFDMGGDELLGSGATPDPSLPKWEQLDHWKAAAVEATGNKNAVAYDYFLLYMNGLYDMLTSPKYGYTSVRMWNDDAMRSADTGWKKVVELNTDIEIEYWNPSTANPYSLFTAAGHNVYNYLSYYNYYVVMQKKAYLHCNPEIIFNNWSPYNFVGNANGGAAKIGDPKIKGSALCVWCDEPDYKTEETVLAELKPLIRANGAKAWDADRQLTQAYSSFLKEFN